MERLTPTGEMWNMEITDEGKSVHGGDVYRNNVKLDFSVNINPFGLPEPVKESLLEGIEKCRLYPDMECEQLREAISKKTGVEKDAILCGNGASELFMAITHALRPDICVLPAPSFYGYQKALKAVGSRISYYPLKREHGFCMDEEIKAYLQEDVSMLFLTNPNNPVGNSISYAFLLKILEWCRDRDITVVLDECFIDFAEEEGVKSLLPELGRFENLILVQAFTKIYAMPGLRLGTLFCSNRTTLEKIRKHLPEWNVSVLAQQAGIVALKQQDYVKKSVEMVKQERRFLKEELEGLGFMVYPGSANFLLLETKLALYEMLLKEGILIRDCSNFRGLGKGFYRIAVKQREENLQLLGAIKTIKEARDSRDRKNG